MIDSGCLRRDHRADTFVPRQDRLFIADAVVLVTTAGFVHQLQLRKQTLIEDGLVDLSVQSRDARPQATAALLNVLLLLLVGDGVELEAVHEFAAALTLFGRVARSLLVDS